METGGTDLSPLRVTFRTTEEFAAEYDQNLANGGLFIPTEVERPLRGQVDFILALGFSGQLLRGRGEVIYTVGAEQAAARREQPGLGLQLLAFERERADEARRAIRDSSNAAALEPYMRAFVIGVNLHYRRHVHHRICPGIV